MPYRSWPLPDRRAVDLLVIGGGINGAGLARDAAMRGLSVLLVDKADFAAGTSSQSSKLVHGGIRYLQQGDFKLVFEASQERWILAHIAPHLVRPLRFLMPMYRTDPVKPLLLRVGLALYDALAGFHNLGRHQIISGQDVSKAEPALQSDGLLQGAWYYDAQMNDARLCLENILSARQHGAICLNYVEVVGFRRTQGRAVAAHLRDHLNGARFEVDFKVAVNATGPWSDTLLRHSEESPPKPRLRPSKGVHAVVDQVSPLALLVRARQDGRVFFILPWGQYSLLGTTETDFAGPPDSVQADASDIRYLLQETAGFFPHAPPQTVFGVFAGLRPLLDAGNLPAGRVSREHSILEEGSGLISLVGGKYTTYRLVAAQLADRVSSRLGTSMPRPRTDQLPLPGGETGPIDLFVSQRTSDVARSVSLPGAASDLLNRYGSRYAEVLEACRQTSDGFSPLCPHTTHLRGEVRYAFSTEGACTIDDFLYRRTWIGYGRCQGHDTRQAVQDILRHDMTVDLALDPASPESGG